MIAALSKSIAQMFESSLRRVLVKVLVMTIAVLVVTWFVVWGVIANITITDINWIDSLVGRLGGALMAVVVTLVLFAPIATLVGGLFQDEVVRSVEARHYPDLPPGQSQTIGQSVRAGIRLLIWTLLANLICLPLYLLPLANVLIFFAINGLLLGREYYEAVALRRMNRLDALSFRKRHRFRFWAAGIIVSIVFWIPVLNLTAPILGIALMVHVFEDRRRRAAA